MKNDEKMNIKIDRDIFFAECESYFKSPDSPEPHRAVINSLVDLAMLELHFDRVVLTGEWLPDDLSSEDQLMITEERLVLVDDLSTPNRPLSIQELISTLKEGVHLLIDDYKRLKQNFLIPRARFESFSTGSTHFDYREFEVYQSDDIVCSFHVSESRGGELLAGIKLTSKDSNPKELKIEDVEGAVDVMLVIIDKETYEVISKTDPIHFSAQKILPAVNQVNWTTSLGRLLSKNGYCLENVEIVIDYSIDELCVKKSSIH